MKLRGAVLESAVKSVALATGVSHYSAGFSCNMGGPPTERITRMRHIIHHMTGITHHMTGIIHHMTGIIHHMIGI